MIRLHEMVKDNMKFSESTLKELPDFPYKKPLIFGKSQWRALKQLDEVWKASIKANMYNTKLLLQFIEQELDYQLTQ